MTVTSSETSMQIKNLRPSSAYDLVVIAENGVGESQPSVKVPFQTEGEGELAFFPALLVHSFIPSLTHSVVRSFDRPVAGCRSHLRAHKQVPSPIWRWLLMSICDHFVLQPQSCYRYSVLRVRPERVL